MITELLMTGLMVAAAPGALSHEATKPVQDTPRGESHAVQPQCLAEARAASQAAMLEAHARFAALPPFSLARIGSGSPATASSDDSPKAKDAPLCKS